jgi:hypothetical protein
MIPGLVTASSSSYNNANAQTQGSRSFIKNLKNAQI